MPIVCQRLLGGSAANCQCRLASGGWAECPPEARGVIVIERVVVQAQPQPDATPSQPKPAGEFCRTCGGVNMVRAGTCMVCRDCGDSSGGCS